MQLYIGQRRQLNILLDHVKQLQQWVYWPVRICFSGLQEKAEAEEDPEKGQPVIPFEEFWGRCTPIEKREDWCIEAAVLWTRDSSDNFMITNLRQRVWFFLGCKKISPLCISPRIQTLRWARDGSAVLGPLRRYCCTVHILSYLIAQILFSRSFFPDDVLNARGRIVGEVNKRIQNRRRRVEEEDSSTSQYSRSCFNRELTFKCRRGNLQSWCRNVSRTGFGILGSLHFIFAN